MSFSSAFSSAYDLEGTPAVITDPPCQHATVQTGREQYAVVQMGRHQYATVQTGRQQYATVQMDRFQYATVQTDRVYHGAIVIEHCSPDVGDAPVNASLPQISGGTEAPSTLTVINNGTWIADPDVDRFTHQWYEYSTPISGATGTSYTTPSDSDGKRYSVLVTAYNAVGSASAESNSIRMDDQVALQSARYWRVRCLTANNTGYTGMASLKMRNTYGGVDLATEGQAISGSHNGTNTADKAFDANETTTFWNTQLSNAPVDSWVGQDFGTRLIIREIEITARVDGNNYDQTPDTFEVEYSNNGSLWLTILSVDRGSNSWSSGESAVYDIQPTLIAAQMKELV